ncbi:hypothetical protein [Neobacillus niacini]|uniref:hypothetical protein n=1 Tax=Neobacillus niacini TaxID=86668 RepID=UPI002861A67B|nr:hypothetical protein [Neobacillus niacini]MDR7001042.1 hypothetical protein [Neobacillus niacini]
MAYKASQLSDLMRNTSHVDLLAIPSISAYTVKPSVNQSPNKNTVNAEYLRLIQGTLSQQYAGISADEHLCNAGYLCVFI